jgi:hypothetical protein
MQEGDGEMARDYDTDPYEEDEEDAAADPSGSAEGEEEGGEAEALADLDDDTRVRVEAYIAQQRGAALAEQTAALRASFQERGFDLSADGRPLVADPAKVLEFSAQFRQPPTPVAEATAGEVIDERPDPISDPDAFGDWVERRIQKGVHAGVEAQMAGLTPRLEQQEAWRLSVAERQALERVQDLIPGSAFSQLGAPEHQEKFQQEFLRLLKGTPAEHWGSDDALEQLAAATIPRVFPRGRQQKDEKGRFVGERSRNAMLYEQSHQAHPDGSRAPRNPQPSDEERKVMNQYDMTPEEYVALSGANVNIEDFRRTQKAGKGQKK